MWAKHKWDSISAPNKQTEEEVNMCNSLSCAFKNVLSKPLSESNKTVAMEVTSRVKGDWTGDKVAWSTFHSALLCAFLKFWAMEVKFIFKSSYENVLLDNAGVINLSHLCGRTIPTRQHQIRKHHTGNRRVRDSHSHPEAGVITKWSGGKPQSQSSPLWELPVTRQPFW